MSRGLGTMQRAILRAYDQAVPAPQGLIGGARQYPQGDRQAAGDLKQTVLGWEDAWSHDRGGLDPACFKCFMDIRRPHVNTGTDGLENSFEASFSRALRSLVRRGLLVAVTWNGAPCTGSLPDRIETVVRS
jgi:hypothetical protein